MCAVVLVVLLSGCGTGVDADECRDAATAQAEAETAWTSALDAHAAEHETGQEHEGVEDQLMVSRVDLIVANEETRRACG